MLLARYKKRKGEILTEYFVVTICLGGIHILSIKEPGYLPYQVKVVVTQLIFGP